MSGKRTPLRETDIHRLPLDKTITVGGIQVHTGWFGGLSVFPRQYHTRQRARYGFAKDNSGEAHTTTLINSDGIPVVRTRYDQGSDLEFSYNVANANSITLPALCKMMVNQNWKFFSASTSFNYNIRPEYRVPIAVSDFIVNPYTTLFDIWADIELPAMLHYPFCAMTNTRRSDGRYALYKQIDTADLTQLGNDLSFLGGSGTLVLVVDGTGSFSGGGTAVAYMNQVLTTYTNRYPNNNTRLIVTKFSDDYSHEGDLYDGVVVGDYPSISTNSLSEAALRIQNFRTGNGGDTNETQLMGIYEGIRLVTGSGPKAIVVFTDAASVCPMPFNDFPPALRQRHRNDGLAVDSREEKGKGSSLQTSLRQSRRTYY